MKIFLAPSWYPTEKNPIYGIFFKEQAQALYKHGHEVIVLVAPSLWSLRTFGSQEESQGYIHSIDDGIPTFKYRGYDPFPRSFRLSLSYKKRKFRGIFDRAAALYGRPDILHAHSVVWGGYYASEICRNQSVPLVITEHLSSFLSESFTAAQKKFICDGLRTADQVLAVGPSLVRALREYVGNRTISLVPNAVDVNEFYLADQNLQKEPFVFLAVGNLVQNKAIDNLIRAFHKIPKLNSKLIVGGDGPERKKLENLVNDLSLNNRVSFLGQLERSEVKRQMRSCHVFVLPSRYETFGVVLIEALASGKPVIATACGGPEIIVNDNNGLLVPVDDVCELAKAMNSMADNYDCYDSKVIREDCITRFSEGSVVEKLEQIYETVFAGR